MHSRIQLDAPDSIAKLRRIPLPSLRDYLLPEIDPVFLRSVRFTIRIQNCLQDLFHQGSIAGLGDLHNHTVGELLDSPHFGVKSLYDFLDAIMPFAVHSSQNPSSDAACTHNPPSSQDAAPDAVSKFPHNNLSLAEVDSILAGNGYLPFQLEHLYLPEIADSAKLRGLHLKHRTRSCIEKLTRGGIIVQASDLSKIEIARLVKQKNFGKVTFVDLLRGLRPYMLGSERPRTLAPLELFRALEKLRNSPLCAKVRCDDPRFKHELLPLLTIANSSRASSTLATDSVTDLATRLSSAAFSAAEANQALVSVKELRHRIRSALQLRLERELLEVVRSELDGRTAKVVSRVYGLDGRGGATLQVAGDECHLTRQRISQICDRLSSLVKLQPFLPKLELCIKFITSRLPNRADIIERALLEHRLTQSEFRLEGIRMASELFSQAIRFEVTEVNGIRIAVRINKPAAAREILSVAYRSISKSGVCAVSDIAESLDKDRDSVIGILSTRATVRWLSEDKEWFVLSDSKRNRLLNLVTKVAVVAPTIDVGELRRALSRNYRLGIVPPRSVLAEFCREFGWHVEGESLTTTARLRSSEVLSKVENTMVLVLRQHGPVLYRAEFQELCAAKGISRNTFSMYIWISPLISRVATGVYALTGGHVGPFDVEKCLSRNRDPVVTLADCGWTSEAKPWIALQMSSSMVASGVFPVPSGMRGFLLGRFQVEMADGTEVGKIQVAEQNAWGLGILIRRREVEPGDFVVLEFNLQERRAKAFLGGAELWESYCDAASD